MPSLIGAMVRHSGVMVRDRAGDHRRCRLRHVARRDRLPARSRTRAICSRPCSCPMAPRSGARRRRCSRSNASPSGPPGVEQVITIAGISAARQQLVARQCRRRLHHAQGLEPARQGRGPRLALHDAQRQSRRHRGRRACWCCRRRRSRASAMPAASPCRSSCATAASISPSCKARSTPWCRRPTRSRRSSASRRRSAPSVPQYKVEVDREKVQTLLLTTDQVFSDARQLSRLELCRPVQQVRPRLPDLRAGRRAVPPDAGGHSPTSRCATRTAT